MPDGLKLTRDCFIPKGAVKVSDKKTDAVAYTSQSLNQHTGKTGYTAVGFVGKQQQPALNQSWTTEQVRNAAVAQFFVGRFCPWRTGPRPGGTARTRAVACTSGRC